MVTVSRTHTICLLGSASLWFPSARIGSPANANGLVAPVPKRSPPLLLPEFAIVVQVIHDPVQDDTADNLETFVSHQSKSKMPKWIGWPDTLSWTHNKSASGSCDTYHALRTTMDPFKLGGAGADLSISLEPHDAARPMVSLMLGRASMYYNARDRWETVVSCWRMGNVFPPPSRGGCFSTIRALYMPYACNVTTNLTRYCGEGAMADLATILWQWRG